MLFGLANATLICNTFPDSLLASYGLENSPNDSSGNGFNAVLGNATVETAPIFISTCQVGGCYNFTEGNQTFLNLSSELNFSGSFTISMWTKPSEYSAAPALFLKGDDSGTFGEEGVLIFVSPIGIQFTFNPDAGEQNVFSSDVVNKDEWVMVTVTLNSTDGRIYLNGSLNGAPVGVVGVYSDFNLSALIGNGISTSGANYAYNGSIDEIHIWNRALNASEIASLYAVESTGHSLPCAFGTPHIPYSNVALTESLTNTTTISIKALTQFGAHTGDELLSKVFIDLGVLLAVVLVLAGLYYYGGDIIDKIFGSFGY